MKVVCSKVIITSKDEREQDQTLHTYYGEDARENAVSKAREILFMRGITSGQVWVETVEEV